MLVDLRRTVYVHAGMLVTVDAEAFARGAITTLSAVCSYA